MKINIASIHFTADQKLVDFTHKKVEKLETFYSNVIDTHVIFRIDKNAETGNKLTEIKINVPQHQFFAKEYSATFEEGIDLCTEALRRQIKRHKEKLNKH